MAIESCSIDVYDVVVVEQKIEEEFTIEDVRAVTDVGLSRDEQGSIFVSLKKYEDTYTRTQLGQCKIEKFSITLSDEPRWHARAYRLPDQHRKEIDRQVDALLEAGGRHGFGESACLSSVSLFKRHK